MRYEARYRQALLAHPSVSTITLADGQPVPVEQVYVPRTLLHEVVQKKPEREFGREVEAGAKAPKPEREITVKLPVELWPKLRHERVVLVEGPAGMGKSTLTKQLVRESGAHHLIPIWIPFRAFVASGLSLRDYLEQHYVPWLGLAGLRVPYRADGTGPDRSLGQWCYEQWQSGLGLLIVDGLDEVFRHDERVTVLRGLPITGPGVTRPATILTSRPLSQSLPLQMAKVEVQGLTPPDRIQFIERYRASLQLTDEQIDHFTSVTKKQEQGRLRELLTRPGHLIQILTTYATTKTLVDTETAILDQLLQSRLSIKDRSDPPVQPEEPAKKQQVVASLALHLLACRQGQRHTRAQLLALIQQVLREHATHSTPLFPLSQSTALLNDLTRNSGLLTEVEPDVYEFETVIWLQHLTGTALANQNTIAALKLTDTQVLDFLDKKAWDPEWEPVLRSWVGTADDPFPLFEHLMDKKQDDLARHRLGTAGRCLVEVNPLLRDHTDYQALSVGIPTEAYAVWRELAERDTAELIKTSLQKSWVETERGQVKLLAALKSRPNLIHSGVINILRRLGLDMPETVQQAAVKALGTLGAAMPTSIQQTLVAQLVDQSPDVRQAAVKALKTLGAAMPTSIQQTLVARLVDQDWLVQNAAVEALGTLGAAMPTSIQQALVARLVDQDWLVQNAAVEALGTLGAAMPTSIQQALVERLVDQSWHVRQAALEGLGTWHAAMPTSIQQALVARLVDQSPDVREAAVKALGTLGAAMPTSIQQALVARLVDQSPDVREAAVKALGTMGAAMPASIQQALVARLVDQSWHVQQAAVEALGTMGAAMPASIQQALVARLEHQNPDVQQAAVKALGTLGAAMPASIQQTLVARLVDRNLYVRQAAVEALGTMGAAMPASIQQTLVARLEHQNPDVQQAAVEALGTMGAAMPASIQQALVARLEHQNPDVQQAAVKALGTLGAAMPASIQQTLVERLVDQNPLVRYVAVGALGTMGAAVPALIQQALVARLADEDEELVREAAVEALGTWDAAMPASIQQTLVERLVDQNPLVRYVAVGALGTMGAAMPASIQQALVARLVDQSWHVRQAAVEALGTMGAAMPTSIQQALVARLVDQSWHVQQAAVEALGTLGAAMPASIQQTLVARLVDRNLYVRRAAGAALNSVQQRGLRCFPDLAGVETGRSVVDLSATAPFLGACCMTSQRSSRFSLS